MFSDPLARTVLGDGADAIIAGLSADPAQQRRRISMAARSRFAEDCLGAAVSRGVRQAVILAAAPIHLRCAIPIGPGVRGSSRSTMPPTLGCKRRRPS